MTAEAFFSEDLFRHAATPGFAPAWRRLQLDDPEGAELFAAAVVPDAARAQVLAAAALARGDLGRAAEVLAEALTRIDDADDIAALAFQLGVCAQAQGDAETARAAYARAARLRPGRAATWAALARLCRAVGDAEAARAALDAGLDACPDDADLRNISVAWHLARKRYAEALAEADELARRDRDAGRHPFALANRGNALLGLRRFAEADACFADALEAAPELFEGVFGRAVVACETGEADAAEAGLTRALALRPGFREARLRLAEVHERQSRPEAAESVLRALAADEPGCYEAHYRLALNLHTQRRNDEAEAWARRAHALDPEAADLGDLLGHLALHRGAIGEALDRFAAAAAQATPLAHQYAENHLYALHYDAARSREEVFAAHRAFGARFGGCGEDPARRFDNLPDPERRLRIGYISPDFRAHSVAFFATALFEHRDPAGFETFAYSLSATRDTFSSWFAEEADHWREVSRLTPDEIRARIAEDRIDILVDLAGHTGNNGLAAMHRRAAPVQATYLGYPDTIGMAEIDYRIVDAITDPPGEADALATETLIRLPRVFLAYRPEPGRDGVSDGPTASGAPFTFGTFNTALKFNDRTFDAWAAILRGAPAARLLLKAQQFESASARAWVADAFAARGVPPERLALVGHARTIGDHLALYREIDLALDTFPYNGTTTTCEAFSMGVPVLGLRGDRHCARVGASLIAALGLADDFLADSPDDYVARAIAWSGRRAELAALRPEVHRRLLASPLCDRPGLLRALEAEYRRIWRVWCAQGPRCGLGVSRFERELACAKT